MAIDARISLAGRVPDAGQAINIFERALNSSQARGINAAQEQRRAELAPFQQQQAQQNVAINDQTLASNQVAADQSQELRILKSVNDFAIGNQSIINEAVNTNNPKLLQDALVKRRAQLVQQNLPTAETDEGIAMLSQGNLQGVVSGLSDSVKLYSQSQGNQQRVSAGTEEFSNLLRIAQDPNSTDTERNAAEVALGTRPRAGSSATERTALDAGLGGKVAAQAGAEAGSKSQAKSNVAVEEAKRIEEETAAGRQAIQLKQINIDETKIKNEENRKQAINSKNARRSEADNAVSVVSGLLVDDDFSSAFGRFNNAPSESLRTQSNIDARAKVDQVVGLLSLESRQKLKGQGTITDSEAKTLAQSATVLTNPLISDKVARKELRRVQTIFQNASDRNQLQQETKDIEASQPTVIRFDGQGNVIQ